VHIDVIGVGASPYDHMNAIPNYPVVGVDVRVKATASDRSGKLKFFNLRSQLGWLFREALDPANNTGIMIPPDPRLKADLCAIKWSVSGITIKIESREDTIDRLGRSADWASAIFLANIDTPKATFAYRPRRQEQEYDPYAFEGVHNRDEVAYDPYRNL